MGRPNKRQREQARRQRRAERRAAERDQGVTTSSASSLTANAADPVRGGASSFIDPALRWHMVRTAPRLGTLGRRSLDEALRKGEVRTFRPRASEVVVRRGRRVVRHVPLLIRTVIVGVRDERHLDAVAGMPGVAEVVTCAGVEAETGGNVPGTVRSVARLDPGALQRFVDALADGEIVRPIGIGVGDSVVVMAGPFAGFPAIVEQILPNDRVKVAVSIFGRPSPVELGIADVQAM